MSSESYNYKCKCYEKCEPKRECGCYSQREYKHKQECECGREHDKGCDWFEKALKEIYWRGFKDGCKKCGRKENDCDVWEHEEYDEYGRSYKIKSDYANPNPNYYN